MKRSGDLVPSHRVQALRDAISGPKEIGMDSINLLEDFGRDGIVTQSVYGYSCSYRLN